MRNGVGLIWGRLFGSNRHAAKCHYTTADGEESKLASQSRAAFHAQTIKKCDRVLFHVHVWSHVSADKHVM